MLPYAGTKYQPFRSAKMCLIAPEPGFKGEIENVEVRKCFLRA